MALARFRIVRGKRPPDDPLPDGIRQDARKHTRHVLRPTAELVERTLADPTPAAWKAFRRDYLALLEQRFRDDRAPFDALAALATDHDVYIGCNCPTKTQPDLRRCHTIQALVFMQRKYPTLPTQA